MEHDERAKAVPEQFHATEWDMQAKIPLAVRALGTVALIYFQKALPVWQPNHVLAQRYLPNQYGIDWHRDYTRDRYLIAVNTIEGGARFEVELDSREQAVSWDLEAGDLVLMRGVGLTGRADDRPRHRIHPPTSGQRTAVSFRHVEK